MSDGEILEACQNAPAIDANTFWISMINQWNTGVIFRIREDSVVKHKSQMIPSELEIAELVRCETCIPIPFHQQFLPPGPQDNEAYLVMEYVEGQNLADIWDNLSWWMKFRVAVTLRYYYVHQLRQIPSRLGLSVPGPLGDSAEYCEGRLFTSDGPQRFTSYSGLCTWYADRLLWMQTIVRNEYAMKSPAFDRRPLAIVHQDLYLRNLLLGSDGQLWMIDWELEGVYPDWFEYANAQLYAEINTQTMPRSWTWLIPWMFGRFEGPGQS